MRNVYKLDNEMKKLAIILLMMIPLKVLAPEDRAAYIFEPTIISPYEALIKAVVAVESSGGRFVYNAKENAVGAFQIRQIRVNSYNRLRGTNYELIDFYDYELSKEMFLFYAEGKTFEQASRDWNGSGPKTTTYWSKIKKYL
jgi:hypothetical protein